MQGLKVYNVFPREGKKDPMGNQGLGSKQCLGDMLRTPFVRGSVFDRGALVKASARAAVENWDS